MVKLLLDHGADMEHRTSNKRTALMEASMYGRVDVARLLLDHGAQVSVLTLFNGALLVCLVLVHSHCVVNIFHKRKITFG